MTINELKSQRRWVLWRLETIKGTSGKPDKQTKVPYQLNGARPATMIQVRGRLMPNWNRTRISTPVSALSSARSKACACGA